MNQAAARRSARSLSVRLLAALALSALALTACGGSEADYDEDGNDLGSSRLRVVAANLTSGNLQRYEGPGTRILTSLKPDVALLQEFNVGKNTPADLDGWVKSTFGLSYSWAREGGTKSIPNGVVSRYPIVASGFWDDPKLTDRELFWAKIQLPSKKFLWAISLHLHTKSTSHTAEANALVANIKAQVGADDYLVMGGDFNTAARTDAGVVALGAVVDVKAPYPVDNKGNEGTSASRSKPYDWLLANPNLRGLQTAVKVGAASYPGGLVVDTRVFSPLADLAPAQSGDSGASNMQHMAVVKDFALPAP